MLSNYIPWEIGWAPRARDCVMVVLKGGPCPPPNGPHRYFFKLFALEAEPELGPGATKDELLAELRGHVLGGGQLMGLYRPGG